MKRIMFYVFVLSLLCSVCNAVPVYYSAGGTIKSNENIYDVTGYVAIDETLMIDQGGDYHPISPGFDPYSGFNRYKWQVVDFNISIGPNDFSGDSGYISYVLWSGSAPYFFPYDWQLDDNPLTTTHFGYSWNPGDDVVSSADLSTNLYDYIALPQQFYLPYIPNDNGPFTVNGSSYLTLDSTSPIPEPATIFLLSGGIFALTAKRRKRVNHHGL